MSVQESIAIAYEHVSFAYREARSDAMTGSQALALEDVSLSVREGERLGILGPNGGGKSTLLKLTLGLLRGHEGRISVFGLSPDESRQRGLIGYVPQRSDAELAFPVSVRQVVGMAASLGVSPWRRVPPERLAAIEEAIRVVGAEDYASSPFGKLSGGQRQRALIARALAFRPRILVLDEPLVGVDVTGQRQFAELIERLNRELRLTIVIVSHDIRTVAAGCDRVACLSRTLHFHDAPKGLTPRVLAEVFRHDVAAVFGDIHVEAHTASSCSDPSHTHGSTTVGAISVSAPPRSAPAASSADSNASGLSKGGLNP